MQIYIRTETCESKIMCIVVGVQYRIIRMHKYWEQISIVLTYSMYGISKFNSVVIGIELEDASVAEWLRAWDTLTMFEATVCGRS